MSLAVFKWQYQLSDFVNLVEHAPIRRFLTWEKVEMEAFFSPKNFVQVCLPYSAVAAAAILIHSNIVLLHQILILNFE